MSYNLMNLPVLAPENVSIYIKAKNPGNFTAQTTKTLVVPVFRQCEECFEYTTPGERMGLTEGQSEIRCLPCHEEVGA